METEGERKKGRKTSVQSDSYAYHILQSYSQLPLVCKLKVKLHASQ